MKKSILSHNYIVIIPEFRRCAWKAVEIVYFLWLMF
jgi:hypothetical protein